MVRSARYYAGQHGAKSFYARRVFANAALAVLLFLPLSAIGECFFVPGKAKDIGADEVHDTAASTGETPGAEYDYDINLDGRLDRLFGIICGNAGCETHILEMILSIHFYRIRPRSHARASVAVSSSSKFDASIVSVRAAGYSRMKSSTPRADRA